MRGETGVEYAVDAVLDRLPALIRRQRARDHRRDHHRRRPAAPRAAAGARPARQRRQDPGREPGRHGAARHRRRHHRAGRRALLRREPVQPRAQGQAPARLRLQAVRLSRGAGSRADARQHRPRPADPRQGLEPQQRRRPLPRRRHPARRPRALDQYGRRAPQHEQRPAQDGGGGAAARHPLRAAPRCLAGARHLRGDAARAHRRLRRVRQRRQAARAAHRPARAHELRPRALRAAAGDAQDRGAPSARGRASTTC